MADYILEGDDNDLADEFQEEDSKDVTDDLADDPELEAIKERMKEMEAEASKLNDLHNSFDGASLNNSSIDLSGYWETAAAAPTDDEKAEADLRSVYVGSVDYASTAEELEKHFSGCGAINRITILCDKFTGHPKGFAYVEFADKDSVSAAMALDESVFRGRQLKVNPKRTNLPGLAHRRPRGRFRARMMGLGGYGGGGGGYGAPYGRPRFSRFRRRSSYHYYPY